MASDTLVQLKQAEALVLQDPSHYPEILPAVLSLAAQPDVPLRRWIATFLTNTFASKSLDGQMKEDLAALGVVDALRLLIEDGNAAVLKSCVLCSSLIYSLLFRRICKNPAESSLWTKLGQLKSRILKLWDQSTNEGVRIACVKFIEKVIATQTPGIKDPRLADKSDISSTIVPLNHPVIHLPALEAESQGFLDRLLSVLLEQPIDPILAMVVINALGPIIKTRHTLSSKIINAFLAVDIVRIPQNAPDPIKVQLQLRSVSKILRIQLSHFLKTNATGPLSNRIDQYLRTSQINGILLDGEEISRKRPAAEDFSKPSKKVKTESEGVPVVVDPAISAAFLLDPSNPLALSEAQSIPLVLVVEIVVRIMEVLSPQLLEDRLNIVRTRLLAIPAPPVNESMNGDFDDYDPEAITLEPTERHEEEREEAQPGLEEMAVAHFELPSPEALSPQALKQEFQSSIDRILQSIQTMAQTISHRAGTSSIKSTTLDSLAITEWDKDAWITILSRLSARALNSPTSDLETASLQLPNLLRERLFEYVMINFREHMDLVISWLTEEWYNDTLSPEGSQGTYLKWASRIFDNILPFIEAKDSRIFLRFLGDLPQLTPVHVNKLGTLCLDPERHKLGFAAIKYLLLLRPPARKACIELCVDLYRNHTDTRKSAEDILKRWAPEKLVEGN